MQLLGMQILFMLTVAERKGSSVQSVMSDVSQLAKKQIPF